MKHQILLTFHTEKPISDLKDKIQQRVYMMDGIDKTKEMSCVELTASKKGAYFIEFKPESDDEDYPSN